MKIYEFGCLPPHANLDLTREQISLAHKYSNALVEIELARRKAVAEAQALGDGAGGSVATIGKHLQALETALEEAVAALQKTRQRNKSANTSATEKALVTELRGQIKLARIAFRDAKKASAEDPQVVQGIAAANDAAAEATRKARAACGVYWGTYLVCEQAAQQARSGIFPPRFKRWDGSGHLAVQCQKGLDTKEVHGTPAKHDPRVWVESEPGRRDKVLHLRVGTDEKRQPIFASFRMKMHRDLPQGQIKWAHVLRKRIADHERWVVQFTVDEAPVSVDVARQDVQPNAGGAVGIDVGWRLLDNGDLRVAMAVDEAGSRRELVLPAALIAKDEHVAGLQALRSRLMDEMKAVYSAHRATVPSDAAPDASAVDAPDASAVDAPDASAVDAPDASAVDAPDAPTHIANWRNPGRFVKVLREDTTLTEEVREKITAFTKTDRHLWQWQEHERLKVQRQRREIFRLWSVSIARQYTRVVLEKLDLREFAKRGAVETDTQTDSRRYMRLRGLACVSGLRDELKKMCASRHVELLTVNPAYTTLTCAACQHVCAFDAAKDLSHQCENCGTNWDQDENAARNILASGPVETASPEALAGAKLAKGRVISERHTRRTAAKARIADAAE